MNYSSDQSFPARPLELAELEAQAKRASKMSGPERMDLMEKMRQAYYGYDSNNVPRMQRIFTYYDLENDRPIFTVNENGQRIDH